MQKTNKEAEVSPLLYNLNVNGLNSPLKRQKLVEWIKKQNKIQ